MVLVVVIVVSGATSKGSRFRRRREGALPVEHLIGMDLFRIDVVAGRVREPIEI